MNASTTAHAQAAHTPPSMEVTQTGIPTAKLGMWLFLASEVMMFAGLLGAYIVLRAGLPDWPHASEELNVAAAVVNTVILLSSSMTMALTVAAVHYADKVKIRLFLGLTILLGTAFLGVKGYEYSLKFHHGHLPGSGIFWDCYFTLTGIHGLHVLLGVFANLWILSLTLRRDFVEKKGHLVEISGLYWHFVDVVWIFLFPMVYLI
ncbi:MAG: cytochrome c oxidase subunit 3 [Candidatus Omnitrophica bacterium]|nr:cytochrome c oxidase subunit 3 [Candidatus Omnitrophota bacterium]